MNDRANPLLRPGAVFLIALSLSIGWGIRGNFGHESGAMIAGVLSATAVAVLSRREDWRSRMPYFALFGGLGWGFGGSISYMYPFSFTESGHTASTYYGYFAVFLEGGLWCGLGAFGTALAATMPRDRLTRMFTPLLFVLAFMGLRHLIEGPLEEALAPPGTSTGDEGWHRHESPLYWYDADWLPALMALFGVWTYELWDRFRRERSTRLENPVFFPVFLGAGALLGFLAQTLLRAAGLEAPLGEALTVKLGDLSYINPETGRGFDPEQLLNNWPQFFSDYPQHLGAGFGLLVGAVVYFGITGRFRNDSSLFVYLASGWLIAFLVMPTLGTIFLIDYGGFRVMPPRSDDWAGILGVFVAGFVWTRRHDLRPVTAVMSRGFILGGIAFATARIIRWLVRYPGHPFRHPEGVPEYLQHYQQTTNWHSVLEQLHGFGHGIAIAIAMAMLWTRLRPRDDEAPTRRWTEVFSVVFVLFVIGYLNLHKLVGTWVDKEAIPKVLRLPFVDGTEAGPLFWFRVVWWTAAAVGTVLLAVHLRRRLDIVPSTWLGKGQLIYILFLWLLVIGNLQRAIPGFSDGRMVTEWVIFMNASLATLLVVLVPGGSVDSSRWTAPPEFPPLGRLWQRGLVAASLLMCLYAFLTLALYQEHIEGKPWANHRRFGPEAKWRIDPILKHGEHP